jgi:hypothetical protein
MWSSTNQRIKALMSARAREKDRLTRPIHVRRADVALTFRDASDFLVEVTAHVLLNDLTPAGFFAYAVTGLNPNSEINVEIEHPKHFRLLAKVVWSQYQPSSAHVLTPQSFPYRVGLALIWTDAAQEAEFTKYCAELDGLYVNKKALFLEEAFKKKPEAMTDTVAAVAKDPNEIPAPVESDEGGAPSEEKVAAEMAAAAAAEIATQALKTANPEVPAPATADTSAADVLNALKDFDPGTPIDEKKAA